MGGGQGGDGVGVCKDEVGMVFESPGMRWERCQNVQG